MRTRLALAIVILMLAAAVARPVQAQSVGLTDLQSAALSIDDLPAGFSQTAEQEPENLLPGFFDLALTRGFVNQDTNEGLVVGIFVLSPTRPAGVIPPDAIGTGFLQGLARGFAGNPDVVVSSLTLTGPLGIGDVDISAQFELTSSTTRLTQQLYADLSQQGELWVIVLYGAPAGSVDISYLVGYAQLQQQKIVNANLGGGQ